MKRLIVFLVASFVAGSVVRADEVAVFDLQWGKGKQRQARSFAIDFDEKAAPYTVDNFKKLIRQKFYVKTSIHRVIPDYLVQGGDPLSKKKDRNVIGTGGPGYTLPAEIHLKHVRGAVAMGRLPDSVNPKRLSNGSQFYVCLRPIPSQDGKDTVFGHVVSGLEVLDEISHAVADTNANPVEKIEVKRAYIIDRSQLGQAVKVR
jgi:peptidyl-prolyl cis-trans isomerase B (cyclophilin B)